jgi:hypothetical protein
MCEAGSAAGLEVGVDRVAIDARLGGVGQEDVDEVRPAGRLSRVVDLTAIVLSLRPAGRPVAGARPDDDLQATVPETERLRPALDAIPHDGDHLVPQDVKRDLVIPIDLVQH